MCLRCHEYKGSVKMTELALESTKEEGVGERDPEERGRRSSLTRLTMLRNGGPDPDSDVQIMNIFTIN